MLQQFFTARRGLANHSVVFAAKLRRLLQHYTCVRVVAHSLGCAMVVETLKLLTEAELQVEAKKNIICVFLKGFRLQRIEVHLLAPAVLFDDCFLILPKSNATVYFSPDDWILSGLFCGVAFGGANRIEWNKRTLQRGVFGDSCCLALIVCVSD